MNTETISVSLPRDLLEDARHFAPDGNLSAYITDGLRRRVLFDKMERYLDELDAEFGPLTDEDMAIARARWHSEA